VSGSFLSFSDDIQLSLPTVTKSLYIGDAGTNFSQFRVGPGNSSGVLWLTNNRALFGTTTDSGALLQIGTDTTANTGGIVFGTSHFLYRSSATSLAFSTASPVFEIRPSTGTQAGFVTIINSGGTTYVGCDNSTGSNFGCGAYAAVFGSGSESTGIVSGGVKALTIAKTTLASTFVGTVQTTNIGLGAAPLSAPKIYAYGGANNEILRAASGVDGPTSIILDQTTRLLRFVDGSGPTNRMTLDMTTGAAAFSGSVALGGALKLANAYVAGAVVGTGYVTIQDSTGTTYRVPVLV
jgi:hypothetical protein